MLMKLYPVGLSFIVDETLVSQIIDQNFCEFSVNVFSLLTPFVKSEICERQFSLFFIILSEKTVNFSLILSWNCQAGTGIQNLEL